MLQYETDICVIGSGAAGGIVARDCVEAGKEILMIEAGVRTNGRALGLRILEIIFREYRIPRMVLWHRKSRYLRTCYRTEGNPGYDLRNSAVNARGGSSLGWIGSAYRLKPEDFQLASFTGIGLDWPISYGELEPYFGKAEKTLRVAGNHFDRGHPPRNSPFPFPAKPFHARDKRFINALEINNWPSMHHNISLAPDGGAFTADLLINELEKYSNFRLLTNCVATRILCPSKEKASSVECWDSKYNESITVRANKMIVCTGGIETPNLLLQSENQWWPNGLGNHSGHLGRHLISHCGIGVGGHPDGIRLKNGPVSTTIVTRYFDSEKEQTDGKYILSWYPAPTGYLFLNVTMEMFPDENNTVSVDSSKTRFGTPSPMIKFNYSEQLRSRENIVKKRLEAIAKEIDLKITHHRHYVNAHPMSTARMSSHPDDGVINPDLRIHMMDNVFVCGSASFPTGGAANPTLTIAALAHRLGHHLANS